MCMHVSIVTILFQPKLFLCHMHTARYTWRTINRKNNDMAKNWCLHDFFGFPFDLQRFHRANLQNNWIKRINDNNLRSKKSQTIHQTIEWMNETHARILHKNETHSDFVIANLNIIDREVDMWIDKCYGLSAAACLPACYYTRAMSVSIYVIFPSIVITFVFFQYVHARARMLAKVCAKRRVWDREIMHAHNVHFWTHSLIPHFFFKSNINNNAN